MSMILFSILLFLFIAIAGVGAVLGLFFFTNSEWWSNKK